MKNLKIGFKLENVIVHMFFERYLEKRLNFIRRVYFAFMFRMKFEKVLLLIYLLENFVQQYIVLEIKNQSCMNHFLLFHLILRYACDLHRVSDFISGGARGELNLPGQKILSLPLDFMHSVGIIYYLRCAFL